MGKKGLAEKGMPRPFGMAFYFPVAKFETALIVGYKQGGAAPVFYRCRSHAPTRPSRTLAFRNKSQDSFFCSLTGSRLISFQFAITPQGYFQHAGGLCLSESSSLPPKVEPRTPRSRIG